MPKRNYMGQPIRVPVRCSVCNGTGRSRVLGGALWDACKLCKGKGVLLPDEGERESRDARRATDPESD
jgi:DnaJ-class molecular chaperone